MSGPADYCSCDDGYVFYCLCDREELIRVQLDAVRKVAEELSRFGFYSAARRVNIMMETWGETQE